MTRPGDELLLSALAAGSSVEDAARTAGLSVRTAYRRLADPTFARRLAQARDDLDAGRQVVGAIDLAEPVAEVPVGGVDDAHRFSLLRDGPADAAPEFRITLSSPV